MEWKDITIQKFTGIQAILKSDEPELTKKINLYHLLTGKDLEEIRNIPLGEFLNTYNKELSFLDTDIPQVIPEYWEYKGVKYNITTQVEKLRAGQYIDYKEYAKEPDKIHNIMAVLCYEGGKYDGMTHKERAELFYKYMPITIVAPLTVFFLDLWKEWSVISLEYSAKIITEAVADFQESTVG